MGYCMNRRDGEFYIRRQDLTKANKILKDLMNTKQLRWVNKVDTNATIDEVFEEIGWELSFDESGNVIDIDFSREKLGDEFNIFKSIAEFVKDGSYIEMCGEDGQSWRWSFKDGKCDEVYPKVKW